MSEYSKLNGNIAAKKSVAGNVGIKDFYIGPKGDPGPRGEKGEKGDPGAIDFRIVPELPTDDYSESTIYLVPLSPGSENNEYAEYVFINGKPEYVGSTSVEVDLSEYVKNTDYAGKNKVGLVQVSGVNGLNIFGNGVLAISAASNGDINGRTKYAPITASVIDYAVKKALSDCKLSGDDVWTEEEKAKALELLGGVKKLGDGKKNFLYGAYWSGEHQMFGFSEIPTPYAFYRSYTDGRMMVGEPVDERDATTKKYVDDLVGSVESILTELHAYAQTKIGGDA